MDDRHAHAERCQRNYTEFPHLHLATFLLEQMRGVLPMFLGKADRPLLMDYFLKDLKSELGAPQSIFDACTQLTILGALTDLNRPLVGLLKFESRNRGRALFVKCLAKECDRNTERLSDLCLDNISIGFQTAEEIYDERIAEKIKYQSQNDNDHSHQPVGVVRKRNDSLLETKKEQNGRRMLLNNQKANSQHLPHMHETKAIVAIDRVLQQTDSSSTSEKIKPVTDVFSKSRFVGPSRISNNQYTFQREPLYSDSHHKNGQPDWNSMEFLLSSNKASRTSGVPRSVSLKPNIGMYSSSQNVNQISCNLDSYVHKPLHSETVKTSANVPIDKSGSIPSSTGIAAPTSTLHNFHDVLSSHSRSDQTSFDHLIHSKEFLSRTELIEHYENIVTELKKQPNSSDPVSSTAHARKRNVSSPGCTRPVSQLSKISDVQLTAMFDTLLVGHIQPQKETKSVQQADFRSNWNALFGKKVDKSIGSSHEEVKEEVSSENALDVAPVSNDHNRPPSCDAVTSSSASKAHPVGNLPVETTQTVQQAIPEECDNSDTDARVSTLIPLEESFMNALSMNSIEREN